MQTKQTGSCLCGEVKFLFEGEFDSFYLCHCKYCQKDTGSTYAANLFSSSNKMTWQSGEKLLTRYQLKNTRHTKCFCSICGSAMPYFLDTEKLWVVPAGSLDTAVKNKPNARIFTSRREEYFDWIQESPEYSEFPKA